MRFDRCSSFNLWKKNGRPTFDTIHDILWCLSLMQFLLKGRNAPIGASGTDGLSLYFMKVNVFDTYFEHFPGDLFLLFFCFLSLCSASRSKSAPNIARWRIMNLMSKIIEYTIVWRMTIPERRMTILARKIVFFLFLNYHLFKKNHERNLQKIYK